MLTWPLQLLLFILEILLDGQQLALLFLGFINLQCLLFDHVLRTSTRQEVFDVPVIFLALGEVLTERRRFLLKHLVTRNHRLADGFVKFYQWRDRDRWLHRTPLAVCQVFSDPMNVLITNLKVQGTLLE